MKTAEQIYNNAVARAKRHHQLLVDEAAKVTGLSPIDAFISDMPALYPSCEELEREYIIEDFAKALERVRA